MTALPPLPASSLGELIDPPADLDRAPLWLPGGHAQTIWASLYGRPCEGKRPRFRRERWTTPDGDFIDADWRVEPSESLAASASRPVLVLFHGLEGSSASGYGQAFADWARRQGWAFVLPHFRGCSGELNLAPRAYHSGDFTEIGWMLDQVRQRHAGPLLAVGISLGGNALLRWAQEAGDSARATARAVAAVCSPIDLAAGGWAISQGLGRFTYTPMFLRSMKPKALAKLAQYPGLFNADRLNAARNLYEFDNVFTAPLHGFRDTDDYWRRASAKPRLGEIRLPALLLNALNDPFVPASSLPSQREVGPWVQLWQPRQGGHVGFARGPWPGVVDRMPESVVGWLRRWL